MQRRRCICIADRTDKELNSLENSLKNIPDKEKRYFTMIQKHENKIYG